ncbi:MAG: hypothetical protein CMJ58_24650 [Planctomycetaceae bacterium]|nr:hypothetical protein [Planctomycetaceae bacterium]
MICMSPRRRRCAVVVLICAIGTTVLQAAVESPSDAIANSRWAWRLQEGESVALVDRNHDDQVVWRFNYGASLNTPFFDPVALPGGASLTWNQPPDHAWHHGLWFSWKEINCVDYWQHAEGSSRPAGRTSWSNVAVATRPDGAASIMLELSYAPQDGGPVLRERRKIEISAPDATGLYRISWHARFTAAMDPVVLDRVPIPPHPQGASWGGFAGLSVRFAERLNSRQLATLDGPIAFGDDGIARPASAAADYSGVNGNQEMGLAILDASNNPRHPVSWYAIASGMSYLNPAVLTHAAMQIEAEETLTLRYRLVVHPGRWDAATLRSEVARLIDRKN